MFLPMTDVLITPPLHTGDWKFSFVAINKHQIVRVEESLGAPQMSPPAVRKVRRRKPNVAASSPSSLDPAGSGTDSPAVSGESLEAPKVPVPAVREVRRRKPKAATSVPSIVELPGTGTDSPVLSGEAASI